MNEQSDNITSPAQANLMLAVTQSTSQGARDYQEDACGHWFDAARKRLFAVVADGAGGHGGGSEASTAALSSAQRTWEDTSASVLVNPAEFLANWMKEAHIAVNEASAKIHRSARTVVVACLTDGYSAHWVHAGDSRLLRFHDGKLIERTRDDSVVQVLFERGEITEEEMGTHPDQSRLLQSLGGEDPPTPRAGSAELVAGDVLILCSDGFWEHLRPAELEKLASTRPDRRQQALDQAVAEAVRRAGAKADNTTVMMIHWDGTETRSQVGIGWVLFLLGLTLLGFWVGKWLGEHREAASPPVPEVMQQPLLPVPASAGDEHLKTQEPPLSTPPKRDGIDPLPQQPQRPKEAAPDSVQDTEESWNPPLPKP